MNDTERRTIPEWRLARDMTQMELAAKAGLHLSTVATAETGAVIPETRTLQLLAEALQIDWRQIELPPYRGTAAAARRKRRAPRHRTAPPAPPSARDTSSDTSSDTSDERDEDGALSAPGSGDDPKAEARRAA